LYTIYYLDVELDSFWIIVNINIAYNIWFVMKLIY